MGQIKKNQCLYCIIYPLINVIKCIHFFDLTHFRGQGRNQKKHSFFGSNENIKICFRNLLTFRNIFVMICHFLVIKWVVKNRTTIQVLKINVIRKFQPDIIPKLIFERYFFKQKILEIFDDLENFKLKKYYFRTDFLLYTEVILASKKQRGCQIFRNNGMCKVIQAAVAASSLMLVGL